MNKALFYIEDIFNRALVDFVVLGDTARKLYENEDITGEALYFGIERRNYTKYVKSTLAYYIKDYNPSDTDFTIHFEGIPIHVKIIERRYQFFKYADKKSYWLGEYKIANPWNSYWKMRHMLK